MTPALNLLVNLDTNPKTKSYLRIQLKTWQPAKYLDSEGVKICPLKVWLLYNDQKKIIYSYYYKKRTAICLHIQTLQTYLRTAWYAVCNMTSVCFLNCPQGTNKVFGIELNWSIKLTHNKGHLDKHCTHCGHLYSGMWTLTKDLPKSARSMGCNITHNYMSSRSSQLTHQSHDCWVTKL